MARRALWPVVSLVVVVAAVVVALAPAGRADDQRPRSMVYVNISGDGPTAKAWYRGAPPPGVPVQEALDAFAKDGYRISRIVPGNRPSIQMVSTVAASSPQAVVPDQQYLLLLEK
jgi:hypothetical protein